MRNNGRVQSRRRFLHRLGIAWALAGLLASATGLRAGESAPAAMAADLGEIPGWTFLDAAPGGFQELDGIVYFFAHDGVHGQELWRTDLTEAGTWMVEDICPGFCHGMTNGPPMVQSGGALYFFADDGGSGGELWTSRGTAETTRIVRDLQAGPASSACGQLIEFGGQVVFGADDGIHGCELWVKPSSWAGVQLLVDAVPGADSGFSSGYRRLFPLDDQLLFWSQDSLWTTDGTPAGTEKVTEVVANLDVPWFHDNGPRAFDGRLFFQGWDAVHGWELWATDGTAAGTGLVADLVAGSGSSSPDDFVVHASQLWFAARGEDQDGELWRSDGTSTGTAFVADADWGPLGSTPAGVLYVVHNGVQSELRIADGSQVNTLVSVEDVYFYFLYPRRQLDGGVFLALNAGQTGPEPWISEGTPETTRLLADIYQGEEGSMFLPLDTAIQLSTGEILFKAYSPEIDYSPWVSDQTTAGTRRIKRIDDQVSAGYPGRRLLYSSLAPIGPRCLTSRYSLEYNREEAWSSAGDPATVARIPVHQGPGATVLQADPGPTPATRSRAILRVHGEEGPSLWGTDGTVQGTEEITAAFGATSLGLERFVATPDRVWIQNHDRVWSTDGTLAGTVWVPSWNQVRDAAVVSGRTYLALGNSGTGVELWLQHQGAAPVPVRDIEPGPDSSTPSWLTTGSEPNLGVFFFASTTETGREPWFSDGTAEGTYPLGDIFPGEEDSRELTEEPNSGGAVGAFLGSTLVFAADDGVHGNELWASDGSPESATLLLDLVPGNVGSEPAWFTTFEDRVYFVASTLEHGRELWRTDGTPEGTEIVLDLFPGRRSALPHDLLVRGDTLFLVAADPAHGSELWRLDSEGLELHQDINPGPDSSSPSWLALGQDRLWFMATDGVHGFELWSLPFGLLFADGFESGDVTAWGEAGSVVR